MKPGFVSLGFAALALALAAPAAMAQTLYKLIDKNGKVTYSESPPKDFNGQVIRMDIDPNANTATLPKLAPPPAEKSGDSSESRTLQPPKKESIDDKRARLEAAKAAYQNARDNPAEGDVTWIGNAGGGTRAIPSEDYQKRLSKLEENVKKAEEDLRRAEGG